MVNDAVRTPSLKPRVLVIPQWCIDGSPDPWVVPSLDVQDAKTLAMEGTAGLCQARATDQKGAPDNSWLGSSANDAVENGETNGAVLRNGRSLLRSDVVSPILVVDLWSAPALFLRYVEVSDCLRETVVKGMDGS